MLKEEDFVADSVTDNGIKINIQETKGNDVENGIEHCLVIPNVAVNVPNNILQEFS